MIRTKAPKRIIDLADRDFLSLDENKLVGEAAKIMYERDFCSVIVTRNERGQSQRFRRSVGIITSRDMLRRVIAQSKGPFKTKLKDIMSTPLVTARQDVPIAEAIQLMKDNNIARLPILNEDGEILAVAALKSLVGNIVSVK